MSQRGLVPQQEVKQGNPLGVAALHVGQGIDLFAEQIERQPRILDRVVPGIGDQLVALDEPVVRVGGKCDRRQLERVEDRQIEALQSGVLAPKLRHVVSAQVVTYEQPGALGGRIDAAHDIRRIEAPGRQAQDGIVVRADRSNLEDPVTRGGIGLDVDSKGGPADDDLSGVSYRSFVERGGHIAWIDFGCAPGAGFKPARDVRSWRSRKPGQWVQQAPGNIVCGAADADVIDITKPSPTAAPK